MHEIKETIDHLYRTESGKMVSVLTRIFGSQHLSIAEDVVQDSFQKAWTHWEKELPPNPAGWLMITAKRQAINILRRERHALSFANDIDPLLKSEWSLAATVEQVFLDDEVSDSQLRMMFTCCHPSLPAETQIALILKTLCGFTTAEIAKALLSNEDTIQKRLYRAKQKIKLEKIQFIVPQGAELERRLMAVHLAIYLLFNEGYNSNSDEMLIRKDLCFEAMRLATLLTQENLESQARLLTTESQAQSFALLALLCFHTARFDGRIDDHGCLVILEEQDRSRWNKDLINRGLGFLYQSTQSTALSTYHLEASIAAAHCTAISFAETDWLQIHNWYEHLEHVNKSPIIKLNKAIISGKIHGPAHAIDALLELSMEDRLKKYYLLPASLGQFYAEVGDGKQARHYFSEALALTNSKTERAFLARRIEEL